MELTKLIVRTQGIRDTIPKTSIKQRMADTANALSRAGNEQAHVELLNESCLALTRTLYLVDAEGRLANIDARTYRILPAKPWGKSGWKQWGLREWEATILRQILQVRAEQRRVTPLFDYSPHTRQWFLNYATYPRFDLALAYWKQNPITLKDWRIFADIYRKQAHARMNRLRLSK